MFFLTGHKTHLCICAFCSKSAPSRLHHNFQSGVFTSQPQGFWLQHWGGWHVFVDGGERFQGVNPSDTGLGDIQE